MTATRGWSIQVPRWRNRNSLIGVGWFSEHVPRCRFAGHPYMVWETRAEARRALPMVKGADPTARVVPVRVRVSVCRSKREDGR